MFTPVISSLVETMWPPLQSPTHGAAVAVAVGLTDDVTVGVAVPLVVVAAVADCVAAAVRVAVAGALGVTVTDAAPVAVRVDSDVGVCVRVAVEVPVAGGEPVGVARETGAENGEVLLLISVLVAVTCGPLSGPLNVQLPSLVNTDPSNTRPSSSESEKISTAQGAHDVPCSGSRPSIVGGARLSLALLSRVMPAPSLE